LLARSLAPTTPIMPKGLSFDRRKMDQVFVPQSSNRAEHDLSGFGITTGSALVLSTEEEVRRLAQAIYLFLDLLKIMATMLARSAIAAMAPDPSNSGTGDGVGVGVGVGTILKNPAKAWSIVASVIKSAAAPTLTFMSFSCRNRTHPRSWRSATQDLDVQCCGVPDDRPTYGVFSVFLDSGFIG